MDHSKFFLKTSGPVVIQDVKDFLNLLKRFFRLAKDLLTSKPSVAEWCPCFSMLPPEVTFSALERRIDAFSDTPQVLAIILSDLTKLFFRIRECVRTHTLQLLED